MMVRLTKLIVLLVVLSGIPTRAQDRINAAIPLPEHPRPDFERVEWVNLNGTWQLAFDSLNVGQEQAWFREALSSTQPILVPFPWGSPLSGVTDEADIAWYERTIEIPADWDGRRIFLVIGASDWHTTAWVDGHELGVHQGGYTPFEFELTPHVEPGQSYRLVLRVDDTPHPFKLEGKQGYGPARGIWQTPYLEARGSVPVETVHFTPDIDNELVKVNVKLLEEAPEDLTLSLQFETGNVPDVTQQVPRGSDSLTFDVPIPDPHLWSLDDPFLYFVTVQISGDNMSEDAVDTYFGMRKVSVVNLPGTDIPYIAINDEPVYLQLALDQAYHPEGFYTFPSDEFTRNEVLRSKQIGLNGLRVHIKVPLTRKLFWADRLGLLIMADVPNFWGEPTPEARQESEYALRQMIARDYNHPSIFSWIAFNETWGLFTGEGRDRAYRPETQEWVVSMVNLARSLDPTRLVEDNSICCGVGHTDTDINSWHQYLPGYAWQSFLDHISENTYPGSTFHFEEGYQQENQPNINSEFGNVWGYEGSTGDVDWSWDYHLAVNAFRRHPKIAGWLYTEHHDVINEWNGYWRYDRSEKYTGMEHLAEGMSLRDLHGAFYIASDTVLSREVQAGETIEVPLFASFMTGSRAFGDELTLRTRLYGWNTLGQEKTFSEASRKIPYRPWMNEPLDPLSITMPDEPGLAVLALYLEDALGNVLHRNFTTYVIEGETPQEVLLDEGKRARLVRIEPSAFDEENWTLKQWNVLDGLKVNGAGSGYFEYRVEWPAGLDVSDVETVTFLAEVSSKQLFGKDREDAEEIEGDYMRGEGTFDPSRNPNAYPMTDEELFPSAVTVRVNGVPAGYYLLEDDPADHRGILSWHFQKKDRHLREAGSYGQLLNVAFSPEAVANASTGGEFVIRLEVDEALPGGLAIYGSKFGRFPLDPTLVFTLKETGTR